MRTKHEHLTIQNVKEAHQARLAEIRSRLAEFQAIWQTGTDDVLWEELVFCIFTAGASARMGLRSIAAVKDLIKHATPEEMASALTGVHRYPNARSEYIAATREFLQNDCEMRLRTRLESFSDPIERRDWLARERRIKGLGYKEASHYLRNIGFRGYAILDKHILKSLAQIGIIADPQPPSTRARYLAIEKSMRDFASEIAIDFDELDLVLWSMKTGEILK